jgi:hypothetical protein
MLSGSINVGTWTRLCFRKDRMFSSRLWGPSLEDLGVRHEIRMLKEKGLAVEAGAQRKRSPEEKTFIFIFLKKPSKKRKLVNSNIHPMNGQAFHNLNRK